MNKLLSIEEEKKFLIDFFHSEFRQYEVEKTDEFGDSVIGLDDNAYSCSCCDDILEGNIRLRGFRYYPKDGNIFCELIFLINEYIRCSYFGSMTFLTLNNERYSFEGKVESPMYGKSIFKASISFNIPEEIFEQVFTIGTKVRIKLFDSVDCKITPYGCSLLDLYRLAVRNIHLTDDRIDELYDILGEYASKREAARKRYEEIQEENRKKEQERQRIKAEEANELAPLLSAIQKLDFNSSAFLDKLIDSPLSIPAVRALSDYCLQKGKDHIFLKKIEEYGRKMEYSNFRKKRIARRISTMFFIYFVFYLLFTFAPWVAIGLRIYSSDVGKNFLTESEIKELKKCLDLREIS